MTISWSKRSIINGNTWNAGDDIYQLIDHFQAGPFSDKASGWFNSATCPKNYFQCLASSGWPNDPQARTNYFGQGIRVPAGSSFNGPYVLTWKGDGTVTLDSGTWNTLLTGDPKLNGAAGTDSPGITSGSNTWSNTSPGGQATSRVVVYNTSNINIVHVHILSDIYSANRWLTDFHMYRLEDETDFLAGKIFRTPWKQQLVDLRPSFVRQMKWTQYGGRFTSGRQTPSTPNFGQYTQPGSVTRVLGDTAGTNAATIGGTIAGSYVHCESAAFRVGNDTTSNGFSVISTVTTGATTIITTTAAHNLNIGDPVICWCQDGGNTALPAGGVMGHLNYFPGQVGASNFTATQIEFTSLGTGTSINSTGWGTLNQTSLIAPYITLNVGARGDVPIFTIIGTTPTPIQGVNSSNNGFRRWLKGNHKVVSYDANLAGRKDASGNWITGVWLDFPTGAGDSDPANASTFGGGTYPPEVCVALCNEVNDMINAIGSTQYIAPWLNLGLGCHCSIDPDYNAAEDMGIKATDVVINGATDPITGTVWPGLKYGVPILWEYGNETWGGTPSECTWVSWAGNVRWGNASISSFDNPNAYHNLKSTLIAIAVKGAFPSYDVRFVTTGRQDNSVRFQARVTGDSVSNADASNTWKDAPMNHHDAAAVAPYFDWSNPYYGTTISTDATSWATDQPNGPNATAAIANAVANLHNTTGQFLYDYMHTYEPGMVAYMSANGFGTKPLLHYEGMQNWDYTDNGTGNANVPLFKWAIVQSQAFANAFVGTSPYNGSTGLFEYTSNVSNGVPGMFTYVTASGQWAFAKPDDYSGTTEGGQLTANPTWQAMGARNRAIDQSRRGGRGLKNRF